MVATNHMPPPAAAPGATGHASLPRRRSITLLSNVERAPSIHALTFGLAAGDAVDFVPGQYATFYLPKNGKPVPRSYSIYSSADRHDALAFLIKRVPQGFGSNLLCDLVPEEKPSLTVLAPLGKFLLKDPGERSVVLVATGVGLAPFVPMLERIRRNRPSTSTSLFWGNRYAEDAVDLGPLRSLAEAWPSFRFVPILSRPPSDGSWTGRSGHVEEHVRADFPSLSGSDVYLCGATPMVNQMQDLAIELGCPKDHVFVDRWGEHSG